MTAVENKGLRTAGLVAATGVAVIGIGELLMHWTGHSVAASDGAAPFDFLLGISRQRLVAGHFMTVLVAPAYFLGYWQVSQRLRPVRERTRRLFFAACLYVLTMAVVWIGSRAYLARSLQIVGEGELRRALSDEYALLLESLIWILRFGMLGISVTFAILVARRKTSYPTWMAVLNPFTLLLLVFSTHFIPALGPHLVPAALNVAHVPFFLLSALTPMVTRRESRDAPCTSA